MPGHNIWCWWINPPRAEHLAPCHPTWYNDGYWVYGHREVTFPPACFLMKRQSFWLMPPLPWRQVKHRTSLSEVSPDPVSHTSSTGCWGCRWGHDGRESCPARSLSCRACDKMGHLTCCCRVKRNKWNWTSSVKTSREYPSYRLQIVVRLLLGNTISVAGPSLLRALGTDSRIGLAQWPVKEHRQCIC